MMIPRILQYSALTLAFAALAGFMSAGCGSDVTGVDQAGLTCPSPCEVAIPAPIPSRRVRSATINIVNEGSSDARIVDIAIEGSSDFVTFAQDTLSGINNLSNFSWTARSPFTGFDAESEILLEPGRSLTLVVQIEIPPGGSFNPQCPGGDTDSCGSLVIDTRNSGVDGNIIRAPIRIGTSAGQILVSPTTLSFPDDAVVGSRYNQEFTVENTGEGQLQLQDVRFAQEIQGLTMRELNNFDNNLPGNLSANALTTWRVTWTAREETLDFSTTIIVESDDANNGRIDVAVSASGGASGEIEINDPSGNPLERIDLPSVDADGRSEAEFEITNVGPGSLSLNILENNIIPAAARDTITIRDNNGNRVTGDTEPLNTQQTRAFTVRYEPGTDSSFAGVSGRVRVQSNDPNRPRIDIPFVAGAEAPILNLSGEELIWSGGETNTPQTRTLIISNFGNVALNVSDATLSGEQADLFSFSETAPFSVDPRSSLTTEVTYEFGTAPVLSSHRANLDLVTDDPNNPEARVELVGRAQGDGGQLPPSCVIDVSGSERADEPFSVGEIIRLDSSGSSSNNANDNLSLSNSRWYVTAPNGEAVSLGNNTGATSNFTAFRAGTYTALLTCVDGGTENQVTRTILVENN